MSGPARAVKVVTGAAKLGHRDVREGSSARAGTYPFEIGDEVVTGWHSHDVHQLEYAFEGVAQVETATTRYLLPPQQAIWIPAGLEHCTTLTRVRTLSVFFDPNLGLEGGDTAQVIAVAPVLREMILYARRWPIGRLCNDPFADAFFASLGGLITEALEDGMVLCLPRSADPLVSSAMRYTDAHLAAVTLAEVCAAVGTSERSLRRSFVAHAKMSWRRYLLESRLLQAMALLAQPAKSVLTIGTEVGFESSSGFTRAFRRYTGETPQAYRHRVLPGPPGAPAS
jgi:AraC-like DNA-binding protein/mannose-6-phosphate isomerase-like protein (cupin superfamily)